MRSVSVTAAGSSHVRSPRPGAQGADSAATRSSTTSSTSSPTPDRERLCLGARAGQLTRPAIAAPAPAGPWRGRRCPACSAVTTSASSGSGATTVDVVALARRDRRRAEAIDPRRAGGQERGSRGARRAASTPARPPRPRRAAGAAVEPPDVAASGLGRSAASGRWPAIVGPARTTVGRRWRGRRRLGRCHGRHRPGRYVLVGRGEHEGRDQHGRLRHGEVPARKDQVRVVEHPLAEDAALVGVPERRPGCGLAELVPSDGRQRLPPHDDVRAPARPAATGAVVDGAAGRGPATATKVAARDGAGAAIAWGADPTSPPATASAPTSWPATACAQPRRRRRSDERPRTRATTSAPHGDDHLRPRQPDHECDGLEPEPVGQPVPENIGQPVERGATWSAGASRRTRASAHGTPRVMASSAASAPPARSSVESSRPHRSASVMPRTRRADPRPVTVVDGTLAAESKGSSTVMATVTTTSSPVTVAWPRWPVALTKDSAAATAAGRVDGHPAGSDGADVDGLRAGPRRLPGDVHRLAPCGQHPAAVEGQPCRQQHDAGHADDDQGVGRPAGTAQAGRAAGHEPPR